MLQKVVRVILRGNEGLVEENENTLAHLVYNSGIFCVGQIRPTRMVSVCPTKPWAHLLSFNSGECPGDANDVNPNESDIMYDWIRRT